MELHLVHWNTRYGDVTNALRKRDGLGVLGILFDVNKVKDLGQHKNLSVEISNSTCKLNMSQKERQVSRKTCQF